MKKLIKYILFLFFLWLLIHCGFVTIDGLSDDYVKSDVAIVLGNKVKENGELSDRLKARLDVAVKLFKDSVVKCIVVSGGVGKEGFDEALVMKSYLVDNQIPRYVVIVDNKGNNTYLTASNFVEINKEYQFKYVILVSQFYHLSRTKLIFKKFGFEKLSTAHAKYFEWRDIYSLMREFPAYYKYLIFY